MGYLFSTFPSCNLLLLLIQPSQPLPPPLHSFPQPHPLTKFHPLPIPPPRLAQIPLHLRKVPQIDHRHRTRLIALSGPLLSPLKRPIHSQRFLSPRLRGIDLGDGRGGGNARGGGRVLEREGDGEVVH